MKSLIISIVRDFTELLLRWADFRRQKRNAGSLQLILSTIIAVMASLAFLLAGFNIMLSSKIEPIHKEISRIDNRIDGLDNRIDGLEGKIDILLENHQNKQSQLSK